MNKLKYMIVILLSLTILLQGTGCNGHKNNETLEDSLSIYYVDFGEPEYISNIWLQQFQSTYEHIKIKPTTFESNEELMSQLSTEMKAGNGPDIILQDFGSRMNPYKMGKDGSYENLTPYINNDNSFNKDNYYEFVFDAGNYNGNQYIMPISFSIMNIFTSEKVVAESNINLNEEYTYKDILSYISNSIDKADKDQKTIPLGLNANRNDFITMFLDAFGVPIVDYQTNSIVLDKEIFREICEFSKKYTPYALKAFNNYDNNFVSDQISNVDSYLTTYDYIGNLIARKAACTALDMSNVMLKMPKYDNPNAITAVIDQYAVINGNSKNKQLAYDAIRKMMDLSGERRILFDFSINKENTTSFLEKELIGDINSVKIDGNVVAYEFTQGDATELLSAIDDIHYVSQDSVDILMIVKESMKEYIDGTRPFNECYDGMMYKLQLCLNE